MNTLMSLVLLINCHEALEGKAGGTTDKLTYDSATPIVLHTKKSLYFITDKSISTLENKYHGQDILIHLTDKDKDFYRKMEIRKDGKIGTISFDEIKDTKSALEPKAAFDEETLNLFKKELVSQVNSMQGEYQNKFDPQDTLNAIKICDEIKSPEMQKATQTQTAYYEKISKKPRAYSEGLKRTRSAGKQ